MRRTTRRPTSARETRRTSLSGLQPPTDPPQSTRAPLRSKSCDCVSLRAPSPAKVECRAPVEVPRGTPLCGADTRAGAQPPSTRRQWVVAPFPKGNPLRGYKPRRGAAVLYAEAVGGCTTSEPGIRASLQSPPRARCSGSDKRPPTWPVRCCTGPEITCLACALLHGSRDEPTSTLSL